MRKNFSAVFGEIFCLVRNGLRFFCVLGEGFLCSFLIVDCCGECWYFRTDGKIFLWICVSVWNDFFDFDGNVFSFFWLVCTVYCRFFLVRRESLVLN